jgi:aminopeptidase-like protein
VAAFLARHLLGRSNRLSYRFLFLPATIGAITWLALNEDEISRIQHGLVLSCLGDSGGFTYKRSRRKEAQVDRAAAHVLRLSGHDHELRDFSPCGYDERQYCSPGLNLPVGSLSRTTWGEYDEYHTSADDLTFIDAASLGESLEICLNLVDTLERDLRYLNTIQKCEPRLSARGLWQESGIDPGTREGNMAMLWVLNLSDGEHTLLDIAERAGLGMAMVWEAARDLEREGLLRRLD